MSRLFKIYQWWKEKNADEEKFVLFTADEIIIIVGNI